MGAGKVGARQTATEFGVRHVAIGLFIAENEVPGGLGQIAAGKYDREIRHLGNYIRSVAGQVFLRIGYEFDGVWNAGYSDVEAYKTAYRRIVDILRGEQVSNVQLVWQASAAIQDDIQEKKHEDLQDWYPGDEYVDWMALSWFMHPDELPSVPLTYPSPTSRALADEVVALARARGKPVMIAESAPRGYDLGTKTRAHVDKLVDGPPAQGRRSVSNEEIWQGWYAPLFEWMRTHRDVVRAFAYINVRWEAQAMWGPPYEHGYWGDSRLETNIPLARRFSAAVEAWKGER